MKIEEIVLKPFKLWFDFLSNHKRRNRVTLYGIFIVAPSIFLNALILIAIVSSDVLIIRNWFFKVFMILQLMIMSYNQLEIVKEEVKEL